jgi:hypothetical protein
VGWKLASMAASITIYHCNYARGIVLQASERSKPIVEIVEVVVERAESF